MTVHRFPHRLKVCLSAITAAGVLTLMACGNPAETTAAGEGSSGTTAATTSDTSQSSLLPPAEGNTTYPLTLDTPWGTTVLEERPERIVLTSSGRNLEHMTLLGVTPVGAPATIENAGWAVEQLPGEIETIWEYGDTPHPVETIASTRPDLIVETMAEGLSDHYAQLSDIAPVLGPKEESTDYPWEDQIRSLGEALDLSDRAEEVIEDNERFFENVRSEHPEFEGLSIAYLLYRGDDTGGVTLMNRAGTRSEEFFSLMGFTEHTNAEALSADGNVSRELLEQVDADAIVIIDNSSGASNFEAFLNDPLFQNLTAARNGNVIPLSRTDNGISYEGNELDFTGNFAWALAGTGPLANQAVSNVLTPILSTAITQE